MRDFSNDHSALALNTATLGAQYRRPRRRLVARAGHRRLRRTRLWRHRLLAARDRLARAAEIGERVRAAGMQVVGLCRTPYLTGRDAGSDDEVRASIDMAAGLGAPVLTIVTGGTQPDSKGHPRARSGWRTASPASPVTRRRQVALALEP